MPMLIETTTDKARMKKPFGMREPFPDDLVQEADRLEIHGSTFEDPGEDWCLFKLMKGTSCIASQHCNGY